MHRHQVIISMKEITVEGISHMQEIATMIQEQWVGFNLGTIRTVATHIHLLLLLPRQVLDGMGTLHTLGTMLVATSLHRMHPSNSGSSNNLIVPILLEAGHLRQDPVRVHSSRRTVIAP